MHSFGVQYLKKLLVYSNVFVVIWLSITYFFLFGLSSLQKYIGKDVNIVKQEENPINIHPPGELLYFYIH